MATTEKTTEKDARTAYVEKYGEAPVAAVENELRKGANDLSEGKFMERLRLLNHEKRLGLGKI